MRCLPSFCANHTRTIKVDIHKGTSPCNLSSEEWDLSPRLVAGTSPLVPANLKGAVTDQQKRNLDNKNA